MVVLVLRVFSGVLVAARVPYNRHHKATEQAVVQTRLIILSVLVVLVLPALAVGETSAIALAAVAGLTTVQVVQVVRVLAAVAVVAGLAAVMAGQVEREHIAVAVALQVTLAVALVYLPAEPVRISLAAVAVDILQ
jgi:hypothetical protein